MNKKILKIHKWTGLISGLLILVISLSGSILVFNKELNSIHLQSKIGNLQSSENHQHINTMYEEVRELYPDHRVRLFINEADGYTKFDVRRDDTKRFIYFSNRSGQKILDINSTELIDRFLLKFHYTLFAGIPGIFLVTITSISLLISIFTGFYVYRKALIRSLLFRGVGKGKNKNLINNLHTSIGIWGIIFNFIIALTGLLLTITILDARLSKKNVTRENAVSYDIKSALETVKGEHKDFKIYFCKMPSDSGKSFTVYGKFEESFFLYPAFSDRIVFNSSGTKSIRKIQDADRMTKALILVYPLHFGDFGGLPVKIAYSLFGIITAFLSISGFIMWKKKIPSTRSD